MMNQGSNKERVACNKLSLNFTKPKYVAFAKNKDNHDIDVKIKTNRL